MTMQSLSAIREHPEGPDPFRAETEHQVQVFPETITDRVFVEIFPGDTIDELARKYLGRHELKSLLFEENPDLLRAKLLEEAGELAEAEGSLRVAEESADLIYFTLVRAAAAGVDLADIERVLDGRERRVTRRPCEAKTER